jgi:hypothetical protein
MKIVSITLLTRRNGTDLLWLHTDLPPAVPFTKSCVLSTEVQWGKGKEYVAAHFPGVPLEVVEA